MRSARTESPNPENHTIDDGDEISVTASDGLLPSTNPESDLNRHDDSLDNIRLLLTVILVVHHTAIFYGGHGSPHTGEEEDEEREERTPCSSSISLALAALNILNQSFAPALFFFISGRFSQITLTRWNVGGMMSRTYETARRGGMSPKPFIRKRLYRLFVPAILYTLLAEPALAAMVRLGSNKNESDGSILSVYFSHWIRFAGFRNGGNIGGGSPIIWYLAFLSLLELIAGTHPPGVRWGETMRRRKRVWVPQVWALVILASFAMRALFPSYSSEYSSEQDTSFTELPNRAPPPPLRQQLGYLPQYILAYVAGHASVWTGDLYILNIIPDYSSRPRRPLLHLGVWISYALTTLVLIFSVSIRFSSTSISDIDQSTLYHMTSGFNCTSFVYAIWNEVSFATIAPALIAACTTHLNFPIRIWRSTNRRHSNMDDLMEESTTDGSNNDRNTTTPSLLTHSHKNINFHLLPRYSYGVILLHPLVSLSVELGLNVLLAGSVNSCPKANPILMTCLSGTINVFLSFLVAWAAIRFIPSARGII